MKKSLYFSLLAVLAVAACKKEDLPETPQTVQPQTEEPAKKFSFSFTHNNPVGTLPIILLEDGTLFKGQVDWGDGTPEVAYAEGLEHQYSKEPDYKVNIIGTDPAALEFDALYGISALDFSGWNQ